MINHSLSIDYLINNYEKVVIVEVGDDNREAELISKASSISSIKPVIIEETITTTTQSPEEKGKRTI